jgi:hypothetical protein
MGGKYDEPSDDWTIASVGGLAGAEWGGGGIFGFFLRSDKLDLTEKMTFAGTGIGYGGNASGFSTDLVTGLSFEPVTVHMPFSIRMVHLSVGKMLSTAAGVSKVSYGMSGIDSGKSGLKFFTYFSCGSSVGSGAGAFAFMGIWYSFVLNGRSINPITAYIDSAKETYDDIVTTWERGFQNLYPH